MGEARSWQTLHRKRNVKHKGKILAKKIERRGWSLLTALKKKPECVTYAGLSGDDYAALFQKQMAIITEEEMEEI
jgi:hypothetical protein